MDYAGVTCTITMKRTLYIPKGETDEDTIESAKKEIVLPHNVLSQINTILHNSRIQISGLDLKDWEVTDLDYKLI